MTGLEHLSDTDQVKTILMCVIDEGIRVKYKTLAAAADDTGLNHEQLSRLRHGHLRRYSLPWLIKLAGKVGVKVVIHAELT